MLCGQQRDNEQLGEASHIVSNLYLQYNYTTFKFVFLNFVTSNPLVHVLFVTCSPCSVLWFPRRKKDKEG